MFRGKYVQKGNRQGKKYLFNVPNDLIYCQKKGDIDITAFGEKVFITRKKVTLHSDSK